MYSGSGIQTNCHGLKTQISVDIQSSVPASSSKDIQMTGNFGAALFPHTVPSMQHWFLSHLLPKFSMFVLVLLELAVLHFLLLLFPLLQSSVACYGTSPIPLPLLVTVGGKTSLQTCFNDNQRLQPKILDVTSPLDADDSRVSCVLQHLAPFIIISSDLVPINTNQIITVNIALCFLVHLKMQHAKNDTGHPP